MNTIPRSYSIVILTLVILACFIPFVLYFGNPVLANLTNTGLPGKIPYKVMPFFEQSVAVFGGFLIKPTYMLFSFLLILILHRRTDNDLKILRWGLIFFLAGEIFCFINYILYREDSAFFEHLHSFGMVLGTGFMFLALLEGIDHRILKYSLPSEKCAMLDMCFGCVKYKEVPCKLRKLFLFLIPALCILTFIPLTALPQPVSYNTIIFGTLYNYSHAVIHQLYEIRFCPWAGFGFLAGSFFTLLLDKRYGMTISKSLLAFGMGYLGFSMLRMILLQPYTGNMVWFVFWEEATELLLISGIGVVLWIFRTKLMKKNR